ncbi:MAG TPA: alkaline phosphatase family protein [Vicinamibacterales bacterium]|nr:alkaline phosphatase family protein [Vicinamibacterales bacterium]
MGIVVPATATRRRVYGGAVVGLALIWATLLTRAQSPIYSPMGVPGPMGDGSTLLANGWRLAPAGQSLTVSDLPLKAVLSTDGKYAIVTNSGLAKPSLSVIDLAAWTVKSSFSLDNAWYGLALSADGTKVYSAGADQNNVQELNFANGALTSGRSLGLPGQGGDTFVGGLAITPDGQTLFATRVFAMTLSAIDLRSGQVTKTVSLPAEPYGCAVSPDGKLVYVSLWGGSRVQIYLRDSLILLTEIQTDEHPNAILPSLDGLRVFVACGGTSSVWVFDAFTGDPIEQISTSVYPNAPTTSTPNSLGLSPDGRTLLVANADFNAVAVIDVSNGAKGFVEGFIPTGLYPTDAVFTRDGRQILIVNGRGLTSASNPQNGNLDVRLRGAVSILPVPDRTTLGAYTRKVMSLSPYSDAIKLSPINAPDASPIPAAVGGSSPIKHVFYVIRENRTYDQVLGDVSAGNGDPTLTLFGKGVTPNAHSLSAKFVLFDNFYVDADVSYDGHAYSVAAYSTDFVEKMWQTMYANRGGIYLGEGSGLMRNPFGNIAAPQQGYLWDYARRANVSVRDYGEYVQNGAKTNGAVVAAAGTVPGLKDIVAPGFAGWDLTIKDGQRIDSWLQEFKQYQSNGNLPQLSIIRLPNDHTAGGTPGSPTPRAMLAENDVALGRLVAAISTSAYWKESAIFVVEDDAQSGPDHVDSHRSVLLVASPFAKHGLVDHTFYTTSGVLRTIELILGLGPMSHYDAAATPLYNAFNNTVDLGSFQPSDPTVSLDETNSPSSYGAVQSMTMDFSTADRAPEALLNEIIWRSVKGANSPMPPPRRSVFVNPSTRRAAADDDDH